MTDAEIVSELVTCPDKCLYLLRKHRPLNDYCKQCGRSSTSEKPCRPLELARIAAYRMEQFRDHHG